MRLIARWGDFDFWLLRVSECSLERSAVNERSWIFVGFSTYLVISLSGDIPGITIIVRINLSSSVIVLKGGITRLFINYKKSIRLMNRDEGAI